MEWSPQHNLIFPHSTINPKVSRDFTQGYGPEEYMLKVAPKGKYSIWTNYYSNR